MESSLQSTASFEVRVLPVDQLIPAPFNPRHALRPTDRAYRKLEASIREFGLVEPLVWNERTGRVVGGHARLAILKALGVTAVPVSVVNLTEAREKALNILLNNQEAQSRYDPSRLADLLEELEDLPEMELTGFDRTAQRPLRLRALPDLPPLEEPDCVTVTLEMNPEVFERIGARLDALVAEFDLVSHIQRGGPVSPTVPSPRPRPEGTHWKHRTGHTAPGKAGLPEGRGLAGPGEREPPPRSPVRG